MKPEEITFKADKKHRDKYFSAGSFAHPAKMMLPLQRWLIERYSKPGDVILDPMAGCGTVLIACTMGRNVIVIELESKFVQMQKDNWTKIQTLGPEMGYEMGTATILQGDARKLPDVLADVVITSPPYTNRMDGGLRGSRAGMTPYTEESPDSWFTQRDQKNIGNLPYGKLADVIMTSPPYAGGFTHSEQDPEKRLERLVEVDRESVRKGDKWAVTSEEALRRRLAQQDGGYGAGAGNIGNLPYGSIDAVITSPPYEEGGGHGRGQRTDIVTEKAIYTKGAGMYSENKENIGEMRGSSYLSAMLEVYQGCWRVLKPQGLMVLVTKNFIRNKQEIRLDLDTIKLCEQAGFELIERHYRKLINQSFWRTIYQQKYPDAPVLDKEDILVFRKLWS